jgi:hypothetical protein
VVEPTMDQRSARSFGVEVLRACGVKKLARQGACRLSASFGRGPQYSQHIKQKRAPPANALMERWFGTLRRECLDRLLIRS